MISIQLSLRSPCYYSTTYFSKSLQELRVYAQTPDSASVKCVVIWTEGFLEMFDVGIPGGILNVMVARYEHNGNFRIDFVQRHEKILLLGLLQLVD